jgi:hypothetical protein
MTNEIHFFVSFPSITTAKFIFLSEKTILWWSGWTFSAGQWVCMMKSRGEGDLGVVGEEEPVETQDK